MSNMQAAQKYIRSKSEIEAPEMQMALGLKYSEMKTLIADLIKWGFIEYDSGVVYKVIENNTEQPPKYIPKNSQEVFYLKVLWVCIDHKNASTSFVQRKCSCGYSSAATAIDWLEQNGYIGASPDREIKLSASDYLSKFGEPDELAPAPKEEEKPKTIDDYRDALFRRFHHLQEKTEKNPESDDKDGNDGQSEIERFLRAAQKLDGENNKDKDDKDDDKKKSGFLLDVDDPELDDFFGVHDDDDDDDDDDFDDEDFDDDDDDDDFDDEDEFDVPEVIAESFKLGISRWLDGDRCSVKVDENREFLFLFSNNRSELIISDRGKTLSGKTLTPRRVANVLKEYSPVTVNSDGEISITVSHPPDALKALLTLCAAVEAVKKLK